MPTPGQFILHSRVLPALKADRYRFLLEQSMDVPGSHIDTLEAHVEVTAPRYMLPADQVLSTFPPNEATGVFNSRLPQIVLRRRTLPWERAAVAQPPEVPWMALVVLEQGEGVFKTGVPLAQCVTPGTVLAATRNDATTGNALTVTALEAANAFPNLKDLALLAHVREVDLNDTELALGDDDGWLAVIVANRLPLPDRRYTAYLISIEGQASHPHFTRENVDADRGNKPPPPPPGSFTYPVLAHWSFTCTGSGDFQSLIQGLDVGLLGTAPTPPQPGAGGKPPPPPRRAEPLEVLDTGHIGLGHTTRDGERTHAWYRGPLIPRPGTREKPAPDGRLPLLHTSDQARRIGPDGRENLSLAAAFEIGRLLALAEPSVVAALLLWRRDGFNQARAAALLAREPALAGLDPTDAGRGFAARAGLELLTSLGAEDARRLGRRIPLVQPGVSIPELDDADPFDVVAAGFGVDRDLVAAVFRPAGAASLTGAPEPHPLEALAAQAERARATLLAQEEVLE